MQAMILAAGLGTRLFPLTRYLPKPLFPILNTPSIVRILYQLEDAGFKRVIINIFHQSDQIESLLKGCPLDMEVIFSREGTLLGTGGGIINAISHFNPDEPIFIINGDVVSSLDLGAVYRFLVDQDGLIALLLHDRNPWNKILIKDGQITDFAAKGSGTLAFTGVSVIHPSVVINSQITPPCSLVDLWMESMNKGYYVAGVEVGKIQPDYIWEDIGTPGGYLAAHKHLIEQENKGLVMVGKDTRLPGDIDFDGWAFIGNNVTIGQGTVISRSVIWSNTRVPPGSILKDCIVTPFETLCMEGVT